MAFGVEKMIAQSDAHRVWLDFRVLAGGGAVEIWPIISNVRNPTWIIGPGDGDCCKSPRDQNERDFWYARHGGLVQVEWRARVIDNSEPAELQVVEVQYASYLRDQCKDQKVAEGFAVPAGASPYYWTRSTLLTLT